MRIALAGDTMLGRKVAERLRRGDAPLFSDEVGAATRSADLFLLNLECCISDRGERWRSPGKPFFFRAPPSAVHHLRAAGVDAVTLANNHALDYGPTALLDTLDHLAAAGIGVVGAGADRAAARRSLRLEAAGATVDVIAVADHPADYAAGPARPGIAHADLRRGVPSWLTRLVARATGDVVLVTPHWGPNMTVAPPAHVRAAAAALRTAGAAVVAGHSAHLFHGVETRAGGLVCFDLGDFLDDYAVDDTLRNDLGALWFVDVEDGRPTRLEVLPIALDHCHTRVARDGERRWIIQRFTEACAALGTPVRKEGDRLVVALPAER